MQRAGRWLRYLPHEVTPGAKNRWPAPSFFRGYRAFSSDGPTIFTWRWDIDHRGLRVDEWRAHLQVATDAGFEHLVIDKFAEAIYKHTPPLEPGHYYWRVRAESEAEVTPWSVTAEYMIRTF